MNRSRNAHHAVEQAARDSYGRLITYLVPHWRDLAAAEDVLAEACLAALESWLLLDGVPEAWLLTVTRRQLIDGARRTRVHDEAMERLVRLAEPVQEEANTGIELPDERLKLLFMCAHPAIDARIHAPLIL